MLYGETVTCLVLPHPNLWAGKAFRALPNSQEEKKRNVFTATTKSTLDRAADSHPDNPEIFFFPPRPYF